MEGPHSKNYCKILNSCEKAEVSKILAPFAINYRTLAIIIRSWFEACTVLIWNELFVLCLEYRRIYFWLFPVCGGEYHSTYGVIRSPGWPSNYGHSRECTWKIQVPVGQQIMLNFTVFDMENHTSCNYDFLEIRWVVVKANLGQRSCKQ